ncbi:calcitonin receptor-like isoform X5 [Frieseomelitta varia]|uniref:calcitonin receptor-like isoform X5 n=1 Tax=Frieseomelitta varia TaxID=561572 RepID=UPI001CB6ACE7|nr:calcitonin receptor-like isoform X5 [Frieseomelitta varia]
MDLQTEMPGNTTVGSTLLDEELRRILLEREQECLQLQAMNSTPPPEPYCRMTFDGWSCWPNTPAGTTAYAPCPNFITGFDASLQAHKYCESNGTWFRHPESDLVWSNYTTCVNLKDLNWQQGISGLYEAGYAISLVALLLSLGILTYFRCWIDEGNYMNVLVYPVCVSTLLNVLFLFNIVRVLLMKLRAGPTIGTQPSRSMRQAFRATLLLVPLLGLHYLVIPFRPPKNHPWEQFYEVLSAITASFQGLCVAILFCFCNGEVIAQFKRKWEGTLLLRNRANSCTATTVSVRCRERRRCDYQSTMREVLDEKRAANDHQPIVQLVAATPVSNSHNNHARMLIKSSDLSDNEQTQC